MQDLENHIKVQNHTRLQLSKLEQAVGRISQQREKLQYAIREHEGKGPDSIASVPFDFFQELYRDQQRLLSLLNQKIDEAEGVAKSIFQQEKSGLLPS